MQLAPERLKVRLSYFLSMLILKVRLSYFLSMLILLESLDLEFVIFRRAIYFGNAQDKHAKVVT